MTPADEIVDVGYRRLPGVRRRRFVPWTIARTALELALRKRATKLLLGLCAMVFFITAAVLVMQVIVGKLAGGLGRIPDADQLVDSLAREIIGDTHEALSTFVGVQTFATAVLLAVVAGGLVADDRRTGAFELYFSRPLSRMHYALGKLLAAGLVPTATIVVPLVLLWLTVVGIAPPRLGRELLPLVVPGLAGALLVSVLLTTTIVGASSIGERGRTVAVLYLVAFVMLAALGDGLSAAGHAWAGYLSPQRDVQTVADALLDVGGISMGAAYLGIRHDTNGSAWASAGALLGYSGLGLALLAARLRRQVTG